MSTLCFAVLILAVPPQAGRAPQADVSPSAALADRPVASPRRGVELRDATRAALRRWARPTNKQADQAAREFLLLYRELQQDDRLAQTPREQLRMKVRRRLLALQRQIKIRMAVKQRLAKAKRPESVDAAVHGSAVLAQQGGFGGPAGMRAAGMGGNTGGANDDYGQQLVDLIQRTIVPASWDVNGGPGSIYYWRPGRALVVRQTQQTHEDLAGVLQQLRRAGQ